MSRSLNHIDNQENKVAKANECNDKGQGANEIEEIVEEVEAFGLELAIGGLLENLFTLPSNLLGRSLSLILTVILLG